MARSILLKCQYQIFSSFFYIIETCFSYIIKMAKNRQFEYNSR